MTPQQRSLAWLRDADFIAETVEKWKRFPDSRKPRCRCCGQGPMIQIRQDLWGFADILAAKNGSILLVQVTEHSHHAERVAKITVDPTVGPQALLCLKAGFSISVHSWGLQGPRGGRKTYTLRMSSITEDMFTHEIRADVEKQLEVF